MQTKGLIFIPDISGFTRFVKQVEIEHSRLIIQELLEILIDSNNTGLIISEIEGDAILFYKFGEKPSLTGIQQQVQQMFSAFHKSLLTYESRRYCQCNACLSAINLTLKVITHYGEFAEYHVKNFNKLIGKDVIVAHELLKNDIKNHEYWLVTNDLIDESFAPSVQIAWTDGYKTTDEGDIHFHYTELAHLKNNLSVDAPAKPDLQPMSKVISLGREYDTDIVTLFHSTGDFTYRPRWVHGVQGVEIKNHFLPRIGMGCKMILEQGEKTIYSSDYLYTTDKIEFSETDEKTGDVCCYTLQKLDDFKTKLTLDYYINRGFLSNLAFILKNRNELRHNIERSLTKLSGLINEIGDAVRKKA